jgi:hypothetical protein
MDMSDTSAFEWSLIRSNEANVGKTDFISEVCKAVHMLTLTPPEYGTTAVPYRHIAGAEFIARGSGRVDEGQRLRRARPGALLDRQRGARQKRMPWRSSLRV